MTLLNFESNRLVSLFFLEVIALCLIASFYHINIESTVTLLIFNVLFFSLTFGLNGKINKKLGLLALGNILGLFWSLILNFLAISGTIYFSEAFGILLSIFSPLLNSIWIISFWSMSLSAFPNPKNIREEGKT